MSLGQDMNKSLSHLPKPSGEMCSFDAAGDRFNRPLDKLEVTGFGNAVINNLQRKNRIVCLKEVRLEQSFNS